MATAPSLSVVIPSYNQGPFIERTLLSILKQDYPGRVQVIVSDGGSTDGTVDVLKRFGGRITWWSAPDQGYVDAVRKGVAQATGELLAIQSSDDWYLQGTFRRAADSLAHEPDLALVTGAAVFVDEAGRPQDLKRHDGLLSPRTLLFHFTPRQEATFVRRECYEAVGGVRPEVDVCADKDLWYRVLHRYRGRAVPEVWAAFQLHAGQRTRSAMRWYESIVRMVETCEHDPAYGSLFRLTEDERRNLYLQLKLFWGARVDPAHAAREARSRLGELSRYDGRTQRMILRHAGAGRLWLGPLAESAQRTLARLRARQAARGRRLDWWREAA